MDSLTLFCTGALLAGGIYWFVCILGPAERKGKRAMDLSGGSISAEKVQDSYDKYWSFFRRPKEIETAEKVPDFVDTFYNLVTDIYEWGWGQSFHFSPHVPGKSHKDATRLHEEMAVDLIDVKPGDRILDVGCGVGGPMRAIAAHSRANVTGITINEYQVKRARQHNKKAGLESLCEVVCGNFLEMPFPENSFDGAYSIEATCHAPKLEEVYAEIFRVLKPGALYVSYEWVTTDKYKGDDAEHMDVIQGIERGDALPGLRSYTDIAGNLTPQEQLMILELHSKWGNRWSKIAQHLPGRTDNEIKNYWRTRVQKQARQLNIESNSEQFLDAVRGFWVPTLLQKMEQSSSSCSSTLSTSQNSASPCLSPNHAAPSVPLSTSPPSNATNVLDNYHISGNSNLATVPSNILSADSFVSHVPQMAEPSTSFPPAYYRLGYSSLSPDGSHYVDSSSYDVEGLSLDPVSAMGNLGNSQFDCQMGGNDWMLDNVTDSLWNMDGP